MGHMQARGLTTDTPLDLYPKIAINYVISLLKARSIRSLALFPDSTDSPASYVIESWGVESGNEATGHRKHGMLTISFVFQITFVQKLSKHHVRCCLVSLCQAV